jgi:hypothetical protein
MFRDLAGFVALPEINGVNAGGLYSLWSHNALLAEPGCLGSSAGHNLADRTTHMGEHGALFPLKRCRLRMYHRPS